MNKRLLSVVLILTMVVFLFAGCGKKTVKDTTLEGTWKAIQQKYTQKVDGITTDEEETTYPVINEETPPGLEMTGQLYVQFKTGELKQFIKIGIKGDLPPGLPAEFKDGMVVLGPIFEYSVIGNKIKIIGKYEDDEPWEDEVTYLIKDNTMNITGVDTYEYDDAVYEEISIMTLVKVSDKEVDGAIEIDLPF